MIGRGALADPALPVNIAGELGIAPFTVGRPLGRDPLNWLPVFDAFERHTAQARNVHVCSPAESNNGREWPHVHGEVDWFDRIKRLDSFEQIRTELGAPPV